MLKTLGKLLMIFFSMIGLLVIAALIVVCLALIIRFKLLFAIMAVFIFFVWLAVDKAGVEIKTRKNRYRYVTPDGVEMFIDEEDLVRD